jgi:hypothetical protein
MHQRDKNDARILIENFSIKKLIDKKSISILAHIISDTDFIGKEKIIAFLKDIWNHKGSSIHRMRTHR